MAESTSLRSSASVRDTTPASAQPQAKVSGVHPTVNVTMNQGRPQQGGQQAQAGKNVVVFPVGQKPGKAPVQINTAQQQLARQRARGNGVNPQIGAATMIAAPEGAPDPMAGFPLTPEMILFCRHAVEHMIATAGDKVPPIAFEVPAALDNLMAFVMEGPPASEPTIIPNPAAAIRAQPTAAPRGVAPRAVGQRPPMVMAAPGANRTVVTSPRGIRPGRAPGVAVQAMPTSEPQVDIEPIAVDDIVDAPIDHPSQPSVG